MSARKIRLLAGGFLLLLALLLHFAGCKWGSENSVADSPFITLRDNVVADEDYASQSKIAHEQFDKVYAAMGQLPGGPDRLLGHDAPMDDVTKAKYDDLGNQLHYWIKKQD